MYLLGKGLVKPDGSNWEVYTIYNMKIALLIGKNPQYIGIQILSFYRLAFNFHAVLMRDDKISISAV